MTHRKKGIKCYRSSEKETLAPEGVLGRVGEGGLIRGELVELSYKELEFR